MVLTSGSVPHYLLDSGLVSRASLVDGDLRVEHISRRNRVYRVLRSPHLSYVVKQCNDLDPNSHAANDREAWLFSLIRTDPRAAVLSRYVPECYAYDESLQILVFELIPGEPLDVATFLTLDCARSLGRGLADLHRATSLLGRELNGIADHDPWVLSLHRRSVYQLDRRIEAKEELLRIVKSEPAFGRNFDSLREQWCSVALIHGDMKRDNCLLPSQGSPRFIDWEMTGWGDPLWDAAGILHSYLMLWILRQHPADSVAPCLRAFWDAYGAGPATLPRAVGFAAARLVQCASEYLAFAKSMNKTSARLLQAGLNIMNSPVETVRVLFEC